MSVLAFLILCVAVAILAFLLVGAARQIKCVQDDIAEQYDCFTNTFRSLTNIDALTRGIACTLYNGVKTRDQLSLLLHVYRVELLFDDAVTASNYVVTHNSVGRDDEIEILYDEGGDVHGLSVTVGDDTLCRHPRHGYTELTIPVEDAIDEFRDRLVSDGWQITSCEAEEEDDDVLPDETECVRQGQ